MPAAALPGRPRRPTAPRSPLVSLVFAASAITAHRCSAISCRIFSSITPAPPVPGAVTPARHGLLGGMKRRLPITSQGEDALAASRLPPVTALANRHRPSTAHPGSPAAAANVAETAVTADRSGAGRTPHAPATTCPITAPAVSAASSRRASVNAGNSAYVTPQAPAPDPADED